MVFLEKELHTRRYIILFHFNKNPALLPVLPFKKIILDALVVPFLSYLAF